MGSVTSASRARLLWVALAFAAAALACAPAKTVKKSDRSTTAQDQPESVDLSTSPAIQTGDEADIRGSEFTPSQDLETIHFDYDAYSLADDARASLKTNAEYLSQHRDLDVLVSGHCDERGTIEYNIALGQKRAKEVRDYYIRLGIPAKAIATISYGKEKPACQDHNEACWRENRRAETLIRSRTAATPTPASDAGEPKAPQ